LNPTELNLGEQPIAAIMRDRNLKANDLVSHSDAQLTHKMVAKACKGRRLTPRIQFRVLAALNAATGEAYALPDLFNYE
jgi:hypothetical protein